MAAMGSPLLPNLIETFPPDKYPLREVGGGFTAQACRGKEAEACAAIAGDMLLESRTFRVSSSASVSSETDGPAGEGGFSVADLPLPDDAKTGILILRNESIFPGMVGISLPFKGNLWVREDGTFNLSGFFRRQIPKFKLGMMMGATADMSKFLDVYHAVYRPVVEVAADRQQFQVIRSVLEAGLGYYKEDSPARRDLLDLRTRVMKIRARSGSSASATSASGKETGTDAGSPTAAAAAEGVATSPATEAQDVSTEEMMETRRRLSDAKVDEDGSRRPSFTSGGSRRPSLTSAASDEAQEISDREARASRAESEAERKLKIAQQVVSSDAPKQKTPFRLWKSKTGQESYDKTKPS